MKKRVIIPIPSTDFDPTETAVPWHVLNDAGHDVIFATPDGLPGRADVRMITGAGLFLWSPILKARKDARDLYEQMVAAHEFQNPVTYDDLSEITADGVIFPGGHAQGMKPYIESPLLHALALRFFRGDGAVGAICHGVLVLARTVDPETQRSVLFGRRSTALTQSMEMSAFVMTGLWLGRYYRTYSQTVQEEVVDACGEKSLFDEGPFAVLRDTPENLTRGFTVRDGNYISARWPGDAYRFATEFAELLV